MRIRSNAALCCAAVFTLMVLGCGQSLNPGGNGDNGGNGGNGGGGTGTKIDLPQIVSRFVIAAGQEKQAKSIMPAESLSGAGPFTLTLHPDDITFDADGSSAGALLVSASFGVVSNFDEACAEPVDAYGPFTVTVDANSQITGVTPAFEAAQTTVDLVRGGSYTICVTFSSSIAGIVVIESFTLE